MTSRLSAALVVVLLVAGCATRPTSTPTQALGQPCDDCIAGLHNFLYPELFPAFGLPTRL